MLQPPPSYCTSALRLKGDVNQGFKRAQSTNLDKVEVHCGYQSSDVLGIALEPLKLSLDPYPFLWEECFLTNNEYK